MYTDEIVTPLCAPRREPAGGAIVVEDHLGCRQVLPGDVEDQFLSRKNLRLFSIETAASGGNYHMFLIGMPSGFNEYCLAPDLVNVGLPT
jgi:hypothetical protein